MSRLGRLWNLFRRGRLDADLRDEIETHLALIEEDRRAHGSSADQARREAQARFGNAVCYRERALDIVIATGFESAVKEVLFAARRLARSPVFTLATAATLALAIGANTAIFAVVERVLLNPLPYPESDRLVMLDHGSQRLHVPAGFGITLGLYYQYAERARSLSRIAIYQSDDATLTGEGDPERIRVTRVTPSLDAVMRVAPALGRWFTEAEGVPGAAPLGVLSHGLWMRRYNSNPDIIGRSVLVSGIPTRIIGVMPSSFAFPDARVDIWTAAHVARAMGFGLWSYSGIARLREDATVEDVRAELPGLIADLPLAFPGDAGAAGNVDTQLIATVTSLKESIIGGVARALWLLLAGVGVVLLIACANVTNLFLVRVEVRQREVAIRRALGAGRLGLARFFFAESVLLSIAGGVLGLALAFGGVHLLIRFGPGTLPRLHEIRLDGIAVAYTGVLTAVIAVVFGAMPVWRSRSLSMTVSEWGRGYTASRTRAHLRHLLMGAQVALALVLLIASALLLRSFQKMHAVDPGFDVSSAITFGVGLPDRRYPTRDTAVSAHQAILDRLSALPGVSATSASTCLPFGNGCWGNTVRVRGRVLSPDAVPPVALFRAVAGGYIEAMGMRLLRGRGLERDDVEQRRPIVVVDQAFVDQFFPDQNAIGEYVGSNRVPRRIGEVPDMMWLQIVGVVRNTPISTLVDREPLPQMYMPMSIAAGPETPNSLLGPNVAAMHYVVRSLSTGIVPAIRRAIDGIDPNLPLADVRSLQQITDGASAQMAFTMVLLAVAAIVAFLLGMVGVYGMMSYLVSQRTSEIGVRLALGAEPRTVARMIVQQGGLVALVGTVVGVLTALASSGLLTSFLYGVSPREPVVFMGTAFLLLAVALFACWMPARTAARISPLEALRAE